MSRELSNNERAEIMERKGFLPASGSTLGLYQRIVRAIDATQFGFEGVEMALEGVWVQP
ncbi:MAG: hypothetical protein IMW89_05050 [Ktedonobacteraceae bacterium]|nr:hypothetical protein [Ktedonobacteraceae bacterium]